LPPGVRQGDRVDIEVLVPPQSETTSLQGGWLMPTRLTETAVLDGRVHTGHEYVLAQGHVLVDAQLQGSDDPVAWRRGRVLGGGVVLKSRPLGLGVRSEHQSVRNATLISTAVNRRLSIFDRANIKRGVAKPIRDSYIELEIHPRYRHNLWRYVRVVGDVVVRESPQMRVERLASLERQLAEPATASRAAIALEAIGVDGIEILKAAMASENLEIRFYAAEALAYLDQPEAAPVLADLARREPAFRWHAITALGSMDELDGFDQLADLLHAESAETRYGAFRAMKERNPHDPLVKGETLNKSYQFHVLYTSGPPLVHVARTRSAEIVQFGEDIRLRTPLALATDSHLTIKSVGDDQVRISRFAPGEEDQQVVCSPRLADVIRQLGAVGAEYADVVSLLQKARQEGFLDVRLKVEALPRSGRTYEREASSGADTATGVEVASPLPSLFTLWEYEEAPQREAEPAESESAEEDAPAEQPW
ncbi:MAG: flagellar basal body P-ring protein FlgI, partial [Planctomycetales bacterium]|nr:flagellar basal body P-ring protein FlgI [Planctomycetales bacterium]